MIQKISKNKDKVTLNTLIDLKVNSVIQTNKIYFIICHLCSFESCHYICNFYELKTILIDLCKSSILIILTLT